MSLAFSHDEIIAAPRPTRKVTARKASLDLALILAFVALSIVSILVVATQPSTVDGEQASAAFAQL